MSTREAFCNSMLRKNEEIPDFLFKVMWTDESTFTKNGLWNRHNLRHWSTENPRLTRDSSHQYRFAMCGLDEQAEIFNIEESSVTSQSTFMSEDEHEFALPPIRKKRNIKSRKIDDKEEEVYQFMKKSY
ncbi:unnamed protein product [Euphydryas editha]|nr:unnamed protein product [Euphydryas editha]